MTDPAPNPMRIWAMAYATDPRYVKNAPCADGRQHPVALAAYVFRRATETFGPRGIGWGHAAPHAERHDTPTPHIVLHTAVWYIDPVTDQRGEIPALAVAPLQLERYVKDADGNKVRDPETGAWKTYKVWDPDAYAKALTSAVKGALGQLGFAQDLRFENRPLGGDSSQPGPTPTPPHDQAATATQARQAPAGDDPPPATTKQLTLLRKLWRQADDETKAKIEDAYDLEHLTVPQASDIIGRLMGPGGA